MAAEKQKIFKICPGCEGAKEVLDPNWNQTPSNPTERPLVTCPRCLGEGQIEWGHLLVPNP